MNYSRYYGYHLGYQSWLLLAIGLWNKDRLAPDDALGVVDHLPRTNHKGKFGQQKGSDPTIFQLYPHCTPILCPFSCQLYIYIYIFTLWIVHWTSCIGHWTHDHRHWTPFWRLRLPAVRSPFHPSSGGRAVETETIGYKDKRVHRVTRELGGRRSGIPLNILGDIRIGSGALGCRG